MSFLDQYLEKYKLDELSGTAKEAVADLEQELNNKITEQGSGFDAFVKEFGPKIADIVERFAAHFKNLPPMSVSTVIGSLRFVINIGVEVYQLVEEMGKHVVPEGASPEQAKTAKIEFGKSLIYFIWKTVDPLKDKLNWLPFKSYIEKKLVFWIGEMAMRFTVDLFEVNGRVQIMAAGEVKPAYIKAF